MDLATCARPTGRFFSSLSRSLLALSSSCSPLPLGHGRGLSGLPPGSREPVNGVPEDDGEATPGSGSGSGARASKQLVTAVLVGRPNVGKSALFNRLTRRREALVLNTPEGHVTRDHREGTAALGDLRFRLVDTAGMDPASPSASVLARTASLTRAVLGRCHLALFLVDGREGLLPRDAEVAAALRRAAAPPGAVQVVVNKCEGLAGDPRGSLVSLLAEVHTLGFGNAVALSAETGEGLADLYERIAPRLRAAQAELDARSQVSPPERPAAPPAEPADAAAPLAGGAAAGRPPGAGRVTGAAVIADVAPLQLAIAGRPNVGKSTLLNALLGEERSLTGPEPGLTRDAVRAQFEYQGSPVWLVDTAGWIQRALRSEDRATALGVMDARRSLQRAHVVALVLDASQIAEERRTWKRSELALASWVMAEGRALVVAVNKMDTLEGPERGKLRRQLLAAVPQELASHLPQISGVPVVFLSAARGSEECAALMEAVWGSYQRWCTRLPTRLLNKWLAKVMARRTQEAGQGPKVRYLTQAKARPPTFVAFSSGTQKLPEAEIRFLASSLREDFGLQGVPIRVHQRSSSRPVRGGGRPVLRSRA